MISALYLIAGIHSTTYLKFFEQEKNVFNPANTQSSSEECLTEKRHTFTSICCLFTRLDIKILNLCHRCHRLIGNPLRFLKWSVLQKLFNG